MKMMQNHPFILWAACFLWFISMFAITWSLLLFFFVGNVLLLTGTDLVNAFVLLSAILMLPTNVHILYSFVKGKQINFKSKVLCCPLWMCVTWIIIVNIIGVILCVKRISDCKKVTLKCLTHGLKYYRSMPKYKRFIDNLQWSLHCCGVNSYKDWFSQDWYDKVRDYEWDPYLNKISFRNVKESSDSVPLSCCKSGSCISNYLTELGTHSINTEGCGDVVYQIILISMYAHLTLFFLVVITEVLLLKFIINEEKCNIKHIMSTNNNFEASSSSYQVNPDEDSDDEHCECFGSYGVGCNSVSYCNNRKQRTLRLTRLCRNCNKICGEQIAN